MKSFEQLAVIDQVLLIARYAAAHDISDTMTSNLLHGIEATAKEAASPFLPKLINAWRRILGKTRTITLPSLWIIAHELSTRLNKSTQRESIKKRWQRWRQKNYINEYIGTIDARYIEMRRDIEMQRQPRTTQTAARRFSEMIDRFSEMIDRIIQPSAAETALSRIIQITQPIQPSAAETALRSVVESVLRD